MKACILTDFGGPENFRIVEQQSPVAEAGQVLVRVAASAVNFGDTVIRAGKSGLPLQPPIVLGSEVAGTIEAVGPDVAGFTPGQRVFGAFWAGGGITGGYASHAVVDARGVFPLPDAVDFATALALGLTGITALQLARRHALEGRTVLIQSPTGGVGSLLVRLARREGAARILGIVGQPAKIEIARELGVDEVFVRKDGWHRAALDHTNGNGVDVAFEATGGQSAADSLSILANHGSLVIYGAASGSHAAISPEALSVLVGKAAQISGFSLWPLLSDPDRANAVLHDSFAELHGHLADGTLHAHIGHRFALAEVAEAHRLLESGKSTGKIVLGAFPCVLSPEPTGKRT